MILECPEANRQPSSCLVYETVRFASQALHGGQRFPRPADFSGVRSLSVSGWPTNRSYYSSQTELHTAVTSTGIACWR